MKNFQRILSNLSFLIAAMLLFLLLFQNKVTLPATIQVVGRMHPLLLHMPIGLLVLSFLIWLFRKKFEENTFREIFLLILNVSAFTAMLSALMGFFLSKEEGYEETILFWHKTLGIATAMLSYFLLVAYKNAAGKKIVGTALITTVILLAVASHFGSNLTHGQGYVWQPISGEEKTEEVKITDSSSLFAAAVKPILKAKCFSCHNENKAKGKLVMTTEEKLLTGGKNGPIWKAGDALNSHIIQNINLPEEDKKHMPPIGKPQMSSEETAMLFMWIQSGADMKKQLREFNESDSLIMLASKFIRPAKGEEKEKKYSFSEASTTTIQKLNDPFCSVIPVSQNSPALQAEFFVREKYNPRKLDELLKIKEQLVVLSLSNMPATDADMKTISKFSNLEKLFLNNTDITNKGLTELVKLKSLQSLSLAGTAINKNAIEDLLKINTLKEVFVWKTGITEKGETLLLTAPAVKNETAILSEKEPVELKHQIPGVVIRYTTDGTDPDSTTSTIYKSPISIGGFTTIKARAIKSGWYSSPVAEFTFFKKGIAPQSAELLTIPNEKYEGEGGTTLIDGKKGSADNFGDATWLGFREQPFNAMFLFDKPQTISSISISYIKSVQAYIMPPTEVEVWGGDDKNKLKLLKKILLPQTTKEEKDVVRNEAIKIDFSPLSSQYFKVIAKNVTKLPSWHPGKGQKGWVFIDEIFFN